MHEMSKAFTNFEYSNSLYSVGTNITSTNNSSTNRNDSNSNDTDSKNSEDEDEECLKIIEIDLNESIMNNAVVCHQRCVSYSLILSLSLTLQKHLRDRKSVV